MEARSVVFEGSQEYDIEQMKSALFDSPDDPRSWSYRRVLVRPRVSWGRAALVVLLPICAGFGMWKLFCGAGMAVEIALLVSVLSVLICYICESKQLIIGAIHIYQRYAPASLRNKCRYEPSCSQYMIFAIEKYGVWMGVRKGMVRLRRCNVSGGGFDFP